MPSLLYVFVKGYAGRSRSDEKNFGKSDLVPASPRKQHMMLDSSRNFEAEASSRVESRDSLVAQTVPPNGKTRLPNADPNPSILWVDHIARIAGSKDQAAFAELFRHFAPRVKAFLMKSGTEAQMAEECTQEVLATVWTKAHSFDPSRASVATWIFTIARNRKIDMVRRQRRPEPEELTWGPEHEPQAEDVMAMQQDNARLKTALGALPDKQRDLVEKAYFGDLSHSEIAETTGLPLGTIKSRIRLALERLRHDMR